MAIAHPNLFTSEIEHMVSALEDYLEGEQWDDIKDYEATLEELNYWQAILDTRTDVGYSFW